MQISETKVPKLDAALAESMANETEQVNFEYQILRDSAKSRALYNREGQQRYILKWTAAIMGGLLIVGMAALLWHMAHRLFYGPFLIVPASFAIVAIVAPIVSMTTIVTVLFVAAFRRFSANDEDSIGLAAVNGIRSTGILN